MGKKKDKNAPKLPKELAGVKIPKKLRKSGGKLLATVNTPLGRELMAAGLVAAGAAMARKEEARKAARRVAREAEGEAEDAAALGARVAGQVAGVVGAAATAALDRIFGPAPGGDKADISDAPPPGTTAH